jgi:hypothetical protein
MFSGGPSELADQANGRRCRAAEHRGAAAAREPFHEALERAEAPAVADAPARGERVGGPELADLLVERALASAAAAGLSPAKRAELEAHLRRTLRDDPAVASLLRDLSRGV